jgi:sugar/nucleoside kinase (ribokinase family)
VSAAADEPAAAGVLALGSLTLDDLVRPDGTTQMAQLGGSAPYAAVGAVLGGVRASVWAWCGAEAGAGIRAQLRATGVSDVALVERDRPQPRAWQLFEASGRRTEVFRTDWPEVRRYYPAPDELPDERWSSAYLFGPDIAAYAASARAHGARVVTWEPPDDLCRADQAPLVLEQLGHCDVVTPNVGEWADLVGSDDPDVIADHALDGGVGLVAVRLGPAGMLLASRTSRVFLPAAPLLDEIDLTGAGNAFSGAIAAHVAPDPTSMSAEELHGLGARAAVAAAMTIEHQGLPVVTPAVQQEWVQRVDAYLGGG